MSCEILFDDLSCETVLNADPHQPVTRSALTNKVALPTEKPVEKLNLHPNNIFNGDTGTEDDQSKISFDVAPFLGAMAKAYLLTGDKDVAERIADYIQTILDDKSDANLDGVDVRDGTPAQAAGSILDYEQLAQPRKAAGINNPLFEKDEYHKGWSRWAPPFIRGAAPQARARPELLTDGIIILFMLQAIEVLSDCGLIGNGADDVITENTFNSWGESIKTILHIWDFQWRENFSYAINPACNTPPPVSSTSLKGCYADIFGKPYPMNQQGVLLAADLLYLKIYGPRINTAYASTAIDPVDRSNKLIQDINDHHFIVENSSDQGWHYTLWCACIEPWEDLGHTAKTMEFLKVAARQNVPGAQATIERMVRVLIDKAYVGNGDWTWYNNGVTAHGTTANTVSSGKWGAALPLGCADQLYSSGAGNGDANVYIPIIIMCNLPDPLWSDVRVRTIIDETMNLWSNLKGPGLGLGTAKDYWAFYSYKYNLCRPLQSPNPTVNCIDPTSSIVNVEFMPSCTSDDPALISVQLNGDSGLPGYWIKITGPTGQVFYPTFIPIDGKWNWLRPNCCDNLCVNGRYTITVVPPDPSCAFWENAATFNLNDCKSN